MIQQRNPNPGIHPAPRKGVGAYLWLLLRAFLALAVPTLLGLVLSGTVSLP